LAAVFQHHDDDVVDLLEVGGMDPLALINSHGSSVIGQLGDIGSSPINLRRVLRGHPARLKEPDEEHRAVASVDEKPSIDPPSVRYASRLLRVSRHEH
jgi:hypothetical protein